MGDLEILGNEFAAKVKAACLSARERVLRSGVPVFYQDSTAGIDVMEQADGRRFEIRFLTGQPRDRNFQVLRELGRTAA